MCSSDLCVGRLPVDAPVNFGSNARARLRRRRRRDITLSMQDDGMDAPSPRGNASDRGMRVSMPARISAALGGASLALACCGGGIGGAVAVVLGMFALEQIRSSGGALRGRATAWMGIVLGVCAVLLSLGVQWGATKLQGAMNDAIDAGIRSTFAAVDEAGARAARVRWAQAPQHAPTDAQLAGFATEARSIEANGFCSAAVLMV